MLSVTRNVGMYLVGVMQKEKEIWPYVPMDRMGDCLSLSSGSIPDMVVIVGVAQLVRALV